MAPGAGFFILAKIESKLYAMRDLAEYRLMHELTFREVQTAKRTIRADTASSLHLYMVQRENVERVRVYRKE